MLIVLVVVYLWLRPHELGALLRRSWKFLVPLLIAVHFVTPGTLGTLKDLFFAQGGVIAQQSGGDVGSGRLASFRPGVRVVANHPVFGLGYGTRIVGDDPRANSFIVDDGWLSTAMEAGVAALAAWAWLFVRVIRRLGRAAREDASDRGRLLAAVTASVASFAVGMATYDAFSFLQVTFVLFIVLAIGAAALRTSAGASAVAAPRPLRSRAR
jgi:O-antigen ligase